MQYRKVLYPDKSYQVEITDFTNHNLVHRINSYDDLWLLNQIKDACDHNKIKVSLTIPCLFDAQADRRFDDNKPHALKLVCEFINNLNFEEVKIFHPHNPEVVEALISNVTIVDNSEFIEDVIYGIKDDFGGKSLEENLVLMSTDAGGFKPLMKLVDKIKWTGDVYSASKSRMYINGASQLIQQIDKVDFEGKSVLIIDDLCVYGGTFLGLSNILKNRNVDKLYLAVSHITVPDPKQELDKAFTEIYATNSKFDEYQLKHLILYKYWG